MFRANPGEGAPEGPSVDIAPSNEYPRDDNLQDIPTTFHYLREEADSNLPRKQDTKSDSAGLDLGSSR